MLIKKWEKEMEYAKRNQCSDGLSCQVDMGLWLCPYSHGYPPRPTRRDVIIVNKGQDNAGPWIHNHLLEAHGIDINKIKNRGMLDPEFISYLYDDKDNRYIICKLCGRWTFSWGSRIYIPKKPHLLYSNEGKKFILQKNGKKFSFDRCLLCKGYFSYKSWVWIQESQWKEKPFSLEVHVSYHNSCGRRALNPINPKGVLLT